MISQTPELTPIPVKAPWFHIGIDFVGWINPTSSQGNRYILTLSDYFTKFAQAVPLPDKAAAGVAKTLFKVSNIIIIFNALSVFFRFLCK